MKSLKSKLDRVFSEESISEIHREIIKELKSLTKALFESYPFENPTIGNIVDLIKTAVNRAEKRIGKRAKIAVSDVRQYISAVSPKSQEDWIELHPRRLWVNDPDVIMAVIKGLNEKTSEWSGRKIENQDAIVKKLQELAKVYKRSEEEKRRNPVTMDYNPKDETIDYVPKD